MVSSIEISFKSHEHQYIENSFRQIQEYIPQYWQSKSFFLPNKMKKFTVLRSPHIDKKSREQFQLKSCKRKIILTPNFNESHNKLKASGEAVTPPGVSKDGYSANNEIYLFLDNIKQCSFSGVQIQIEIIYKSYLN